MVRAAVLAAALTFGWAGTSRLAAAAVHFTTVGTNEATEYAASVRLAGTTAYLTDGSAGVQILDVSDPASPVSIGKFDSPGSAVELQLAGNRAYLADGDHGMAILDLTNPTAPVVLGTYNPGVLCLDVKVVGNRAYLACADAGLHIVDITDPANPVQLGAYLPTSAEWFPWANKLQVVGNVVYLATGFFVVVDVSDPTNPVELSRWDKTVVPDCRVSGNRLYLATGDDGVVVFDVTTPANPVRLTKVPAPGGAYATLLQGNRVFTHSGVVDVSNPVSPVLLGRYPQMAWGDQGITVVGDLVYLPSGATRLSILRMQTGEPQSLSWNSPEHRVIPVGRSEPVGAVSNSGLPVTAQVVSGPATIQDGQITVTGPGKIELKLEQSGNGTFLPVAETRFINERFTGFSEVGMHLFRTNAYGARVVGGRAFVGNDGEGLRILDVSDPTQPRLISTVPTTNQVFEADVVGNHAYVADGDGGLKVVDVQDPTHPVVVGQLPAGTAIAVKVAGSHAYVTDFSGKKVYVVNIADPAKPVVASEIPLPGDGRSALVVASRLYVAAGWAGVVVFDVSQPTTPVEVTRFGGDGYVRGMAVQGNTVLVPDYFRGTLTAFDLSDPKSPVELGKVDCGGFARRVEIRDQVAFVAAEGAGLVAVDISDPTGMTVLGKVDTGGYARDIQIDGPLLHVADQRVGFRTYRLDQIGYHNGVSSSMAATTTFGVPVPLAGVSDNGLPVRFVVTGGPGRIEGDRLVPTGIGRIELRASTEPTAEYLAAERSLVVVSRLPDVGVRRSGAALQAAWTAGLPQARLQGSTGIADDAGWQDVAATSSEANGEVQVPLQPTAAEEYFRLWHPYAGVPEPLSLKGWNRDVVLENQAEPKAEMISMFSGTWFESGLGGFEVGLPPSREIRVQQDGGVPYRLQPYTTNNVLLLTDEEPTGSLVLETPTACSKLFILSAVDSERGAIGALVVHYADGSSSGPILWVTHSWSGYDLEGQPTPVAFQGVGRSLKSAEFVFSYGDTGFSMFQSEVDLSGGANAGKPIARIEFLKSFEQATATGVYAVSGVRMAAKP
jgi:hypothetical protein